MNTTIRILCMFNILIIGNIYAAASSSDMAAPSKEIPPYIPSLQSLVKRTLIKQATTGISQELSSAAQPETIISRERGSYESISRRLKSRFPHANLDQVITTLVEHPTYESIDKEYIENIMYRYFGKLPETLEIELFVELANALAVDYFMTRNLKNPDNLPPFLHQYFKGISIQDLIDYGRPLDIHLGSLELNLRYIGDIGAHDLAKIPGIKQVQWLNLRNNYIGNIAPGAFTGLVNLETIELSGNLIANSKRRAGERKRIEAELKMVTGRDHVARWQLGE